MIWLSKFQIGEDRTKLTTAGAMQSRISIVPTELKVKGRTVAGKLKKVSLDKTYEDITVICNYMKRSDVDDLQSVIMNSNELLFVKFFDTDGLVSTEHRTSISRTEARIRLTSRRFITINEVVLESAPTGTNYGGTIDEETGVVTFATALPAGSDNQDIIIKYTYQGWKGDVDIKSVSIFFNKATGYWGITFLIKGI